MSTKLQTIQEVPQLSNKIKMVLFVLIMIGMAVQLIESSTREERENEARIERKRKMVAAESKKIQRTTSDAATYAKCSYAQAKSLKLSSAISRKCSNASNVVSRGYAEEKKFVQAKKALLTAKYFGYSADLASDEMADLDSAQLNHDVEIHFKKIKALKKGSEKAAEIIAARQTLDSSTTKSLSIEKKLKGLEKRYHRKIAAEKRNQAKKRKRNFAKKAVRSWRNKIGAPSGGDQCVDACTSFCESYGEMEWENAVVCMGACVGKAECF